MPDMTYHLIDDRNVIVTDLNQLKSDIGADVTHGDIDSNNSRSNAVTLLYKCQEQLKTSKGAKPALILVYRSVATGGVSRDPKKFIAKPLTYKAKSIDPKLIDSDEFGRLSGLLPANSIVSKSRKDEEVANVAKKLHCMRVDKSFGNQKSYLHYDKTSKKLVWKESQVASSNTMAVTFCASSTNVPYIADWDLVSLAVKNSSIDVMKNATDYESLLTKMLVKNGSGSGEQATGYCPKWLEDSITQLHTSGVSVTRHGPESLYCGNDITGDGIVLLSTEVLPGVEKKMTKQEGVTDAAQYQSNFDQYKVAQTTLADNWTFYRFAEFDGLAQRLDIPDLVEELNDKIRQKFVRSPQGLKV